MQWHSWISASTHGVYLRLLIPSHVPISVAKAARIPRIRNRPIAREALRAPIHLRLRCRRVLRSLLRVERGAICVPVALHGMHLGLRRRLGRGDGGGVEGLLRGGRHGGDVGHVAGAASLLWLYMRMRRGECRVSMMSHGRVAVICARSGCE